MKHILVLSAFFLFISCAEKKGTTIVKKVLVQTACGQCQFGMESQQGCDLAVKIDDVSYFVDGANIDDYGDAHDKKNGLCNFTRKAEVTGKIKNNRFLISKFTVLD